MAQATEKKEFLTFKLGKEEFAVAIDRVQEIRGWEKPNPLPNVPSYVKGVIDLRGTVVPVLDLRERFKLKAEVDATTVVIVVQILTAQGERVVGLVVDAVSDVHAFDLNGLQPPPDVSSQIDNHFMQGLATISESGKAITHTNDINKKDPNAKQEKGHMVILIDIDRLATDGLLEQVANVDDVPLRNG